MLTPRNLPVIISTPFPASSDLTNCGLALRLHLKSHFQVCKSEIEVVLREVGKLEYATPESQTFAWMPFLDLIIKQHFKVTVQFLKLFLF